MNELAHWMADITDCIYCGKPCVDFDEEGQPIHPECAAEKLMAEAEAREDR